MDKGSDQTYRHWRIGYRLTLMLVVSAVLAWRCRQGAPIAQVVVIFVLYVAIATLWVRGQYQASVDARRQNNFDLRPYTFPAKVSLLAAAVAAVCIWIGVQRDRSTLLLGGAIFGYFALGYLLMWARSYEDEPRESPPGTSGEAPSGWQRTKAWCKFCWWRFKAWRKTWWPRFKARRKTWWPRLKSWLKTCRPQFKAWRRRHHGRFGFAVAVLAAAALLMLVGLLLLEKHSWALLPIGLGLALAPIGLSVAAEPITRQLQKPGHTTTIAVLATVGAVVLTADVVHASRRVDTPHIAIIAFTALALLVLAVVSSTQADIAVVIAAACLMGVTNASIPKPADLTPNEGQRVLVSLGDSYMSGEGAATYFTEEVDRDAGTHENNCHRAPTAWAALEGRRDKYFDSVKFLACSGARTFNVQHHEGRKDSTQQIQYNEPGTQLDQYAAFKKSMDIKPDSFTPELAVVSLGGNDAGFSTIGAMCLAPGSCLDKRDLWEGSLNQVRDALTATFAQIDAEFPRTPVLVTAYPNPIYTDPTTGAPLDCNKVTLSPGDLEFISTFLPQLNEKVEAAAKTQGFFFLDEMETSLQDAQLQLCDPGNNGRPGINFVGLSSVGGIAEQRFNPKNWYHNSLHPNERGHAAMLQVFQTWLDANPDKRARETIRERVTTARKKTETSSEPSQGVLPVANKAPCDLFPDAQSTKTKCLSEGTTWAKGQVANKLLFETSDDWWGLQIALAVLGAWLLSVALLGAWKPWWGVRPQTRPPNPDPDSQHDNPRPRVDGDDGLRQMPEDTVES